MTSRERLVAACRGGDVDQKPVLLWPSGVGDGSDARIVHLCEVRLALANEPEKACLAEVLSPLGRAMAEGLDLNALLDAEPATGNQRLDALVREAQFEMLQALEAGADGIFYRLQGAHPEGTTPMQYGGYYLERDRELLQGVSDARLNVLFVEGGPEPYLDFVSDLPAHLFAWEDASIHPAAVHSMRPGALAAGHPEAEVLLASNLSVIADFIRPTGEWAPVTHHG